MLVRKITVSCAYCGKEKQVSLSVFMRNTLGVFFCSRAEKGKWQHDPGHLKRIIAIAASAQRRSGA